ncbi:arginine utilization regulatory protein RocR [Oxobacter pfennigii]|uniref:Arginine utilization regulatory protein RocR n=1 Tax=Oxobacter pfennigii TaxID=36849 RepID=A0A0P8Y7N0_9CLOT|nr:sigma 54-interacting transcriptional regulator [Oxobacter pfennigii]KPU42521.1 arginine utilization regulatory protein RocR [Oxobacter pfennigii]
MDNNILRSVLSVLLKYIDEGIHVIDKKGNTIIYNNAMERLEGLKSEDVLGKNLLDIFPSLDENTSTLYKALTEGSPIIDRYQTYTNREGYKITSLNSTIPLLLDDEIIGSLEISKDYTGLKSLYDKISTLQQEIINKENGGGTRHYSFKDLIGCNLNFLNAVSVAQKASRSSSTVLIYGETGTGKELVAQGIHSSGNRHGKPFIAQNCAALPEDLLEGILFGTVKGGFTGAVNRPGLFEQANGGTLLLDEINSMNINLQSKLLRILQEGSIRRIGGVNDLPIDVRIIATTNVDPIKAVDNGTLRDDLYYRLNVVNITIPPLRERREDIPLLIRHFIALYNKAMTKDIWYISEDAERSMMAYSWPGNVRELRNYIEGAMNMVSSGHIISREHFTGTAQSNLFREKDYDFPPKDYELKISLDHTLLMVEKKIISDALKKCEGNISKCARVLNIKRQTLQHKIKKFNL